jgi:oxaloacetate decarboxylase gamma subunit
MSLAEQLLAGLELTLTGMVTVFILLSFMVLAIGWMSKLAHRLAPPSRSVPMGARTKADTAEDREIVAAISAAIHQFRSTRG